MNKKKKIKTLSHLFVDIGGVLLTNGWDHPARKRAAVKFNIDYKTMEERHHLTFDTFEEGKITLEEYLNRAVFFEKRPFTLDQFRRFMFDQSQPCPKMIELIRSLKDKYALKIVIVSNEGRELNAHRIQKFKLNCFVDCFISSCFVSSRKPDVKIFQYALDISQATPEQTLYIENTSMFVEVAESLGIQSLLHLDYTSTCEKLASYGLIPG